MEYLLLSSPLLSSEQGKREESDVAVGPGEGRRPLYIYSLIIAASFIWTAMPLSLQYISSQNTLLAAARLITTLR